LNSNDPFDDDAQRLVFDGLPLLMVLFLFLLNVLSGIRKILMVFFWILLDFYWMHELGLTTIDMTLASKTVMFYPRVQQHEQS